MSEKNEWKKKWNKRRGNLCTLNASAVFLAAKKHRLYFPCDVVVVGGCGGTKFDSEPEWTLCIGTDFAAILGVCILVWLEKLDPARVSDVKRSCCRPSKMRISVRKELVAVADCRKK